MEKQAKHFMESDYERQVVRKTVVVAKISESRKQGVF